MEKSDSEKEFKMMDNIPFKHINYDVLLKMARYLDPENMMGNNWKLLADKLGYSTQHIFVSKQFHM